MTSDPAAKEGRGHTPGKWLFGPNPIDKKEQRIYTDVKAAIAFLATGDPDTPANARRIVACVNACEGFTTAQLENRAFMDVLRERERKLWSKSHD